MSNQNKFAVIGLGSFGTSVAEKLIKSNCEVAVFDSDQKKIDQFVKTYEKCKYAICVDSTNFDFVKEHNLISFDGVILGIASKMQSAILTATNLQSNNIKNIMLRAKNKTQKHIYEKMGFNNIFLPDAEIGDVVARRIIYGISNQIKIIDSKYVAAKVIVKNKKLAGQTLLELNLINSNKQDFFTVYLKRDKKYYTPAKAGPLLLNDKILIIVNGKKINTIIDKFEDDALNNLAQKY